MKQKYRDTMLHDKVGSRASEVGRRIKGGKYIPNIFPLTSYLLRLTLSCVFFCLMAATAAAQGVSFEAGVDRTTVELGSFLQLTATVTGAQNVDPLELPEIDGFQSRYVGPSTRISIVNGKYSSSTAFIYNLYPEKTGQFQIPALEVDIQGQKYSSRPIDIQVVDAGAPVDSGQDNSSAVQSLKDRIFVVMGTPQKEYYLNERIPLTVKLFVAGLSVKNVQYPEFERIGFTKDDYQEPRQYHQVINGIRYQVVEFQTSIYPTRTGELSIGPAKETCTLLFKDPNRRSFGMGGVFDDDFFGGFFDSYDARSVTLESEPLPLIVHSLPEQGKPEDFSGGVGRFDFDMTVGPAEVKVGDPITVRMKISGDGNLKDVNFPKITAKGDFKFYDPQINLQGGEKVLEQVVIPRSDKMNKLPAVSFGYFDPGKAEYQNILRGPFDLKILPAQQEDGAKVVGLSATEDAPVEEETLGRDIVFIKNLPGRFQPAGTWLAGRNVFAVAFVLFLVGWAGFWVQYKITHRLRTDEKFARRLRAPRHARNGLQQAQNYLQKGEQKLFYDTLFKTLQNYFANRWHMPVGTVNISSVTAIMKDKNANPAMLEKVRLILEQCESVRYALMLPDQGKAMSDYKKAEEIIDYFERL